MVNDLPLPPELQALLEKREAERRERERREAQANLPPGDERRAASNRRQNDRRSK